MSYVRNIYIYVYIVLFDNNKKKVACIDTRI